MVKKAKATVAEAETGPPVSKGRDSSKVMYIGHLPHGFFEKQLQGFFSQFGQVTKVRVSRNKKTGRAKHYAFLEFKSPEVARIAAEAMDGYMMFAQKLDCHVLAKADVHKDLWKGANKRFKAKPMKKLETSRHDKPRTTEQQAERLKRAVNRDKKRKKMLKDAGIKYKYDALEAPAKQ